MLRRLRPRIVITHHRGHWHPDHDATSRLVTEACYLAGLSNYGSGDAAPFRPERILYALATLDHDAVRPSFVVDISAQWPAKLQAVRAYASQFLPPPGTRASALDHALRNLELSARWHGRSIGVKFGEGFVTREPVAVAGLQTIVPRRS